MKRGNLWLAVLAILTLLYGVSLAQQKTARTARTAWEYRILPISNITEGNQALTELGAEGWELAAVQTVLIPQTMPAESAVSSSNAVEAYYFFKRVK